MKLKKGFVRTSLTALLSLFTAYSFAATQSTGTVSNLLVMNSSPAVLVIMSSTPTGTAPSCNTQLQFAVDTSTAAGKATYASLLLAKSQNLTISVYGDGTCSVWGDRETIQTVVL